MFEYLLLRIINSHSPVMDETVRASRPKSPSGRIAIAAVSPVPCKLDARGEVSSAALGPAAWAGVEKC